MTDAVADSTTATAQEQVLSLLAAAGRTSTPPVAAGPGSLSVASLLRVTSTTGGLLTVATPALEAALARVASVTRLVPAEFVKAGEAGGC